MACPPRRCGKVTSNDGAEADDAKLPLVSSSVLVKVAIID